MNNNNNQQHPGMANNQIDSMATNPYHQQSQQYLERDAQPPLEGVSQPAINSNASMPSINYGTGIPDQRSGGYIPDGGTPFPHTSAKHEADVQAGTILSDTTYVMGQNGITEHNNMSTNTTDQWERQTRAAQRDATQGKSRYNTPVTQTPSVAPNIEEQPKPSEAQLATLRKRDKLLSINNRFKTLQRDEQVTRLKLTNIQSALRNLRAELDELETK